MNLPFTVSPGLDLWIWRIGNDCQIPIEYECEAPEPATLLSPGAGLVITPINAFINGEWLPVDDVFGEEKCEWIADRIAEDWMVV